MDVGDDEFRERYQFLSELNALRERIQRTVERADELSRESKNVESLLANDEDAQRVLAELNDAVTAGKEPLAGRRSFRNPTLSTQASRLFNELSGNEVQQGTLHGPTAVQRTRLTELAREAEQAMQELQAAINAAVPRMNELLRSGELTVK